MSDDDDEDDEITATTLKQQHRPLLRYKKQMSVYRFDCTINTLLIAFHGRLSQRDLSGSRPCICVFQFRFAAMISEFNESAPHSVSSVRFVVFHVLYRVARKYTFAKLPIYSHILISFLPFNSFDLFLALAPTVSSLIFPFTEYIECSVVRSSGRRLFMLQQIDLPILGMKSKLVNNEIVTQATNSMCKVTIQKRRKENLPFGCICSFVLCVCICVCRIGWNNIALPCNMQIMGMNYYLESNLSRPPSGRYALAYARSCAGSEEENT